MDDVIKTIKARGKQPKIIIMSSGNLTIPFIKKE